MIVEFSACVRFSTYIVLSMSADIVVVEVRLAWCCFLGVKILVRGILSTLKDGIEQIQARSRLHRGVRILFGSQYQETIHLGFSVAIIHIRLVLWDDGDQLVIRTANNAIVTETEIVIEIAKTAIEIGIVTATPTGEVVLVLTVGNTCGFLVLNGFYHYSVGGTSVLASGMVSLGGATQYYFFGLGIGFCGKICGCEATQTSSTEQPSLRLATAGGIDSHVDPCIIFYALFPKGTRCWYPMHIWLSEISQNGFSRSIV